MAILKSKQAHTMNLEEKKQKLRDLKMELVKANVAANRSNAKTKEIKRAISRILTTMKSSKLNKPAKSGGELKKG